MWETWDLLFQIHKDRARNKSMRNALKSELGGSGKGKPLIVLNMTEKKR